MPCWLRQQSVVNFILSCLDLGEKQEGTAGNREFFVGVRLLSREDSQRCPLTFLSTLASCLFVFSFMLLVDLIASARCISLAVHLSALRRLAAAAFRYVVSREKPSWWSFVDIALYESPFPSP